VVHASPDLIFVQSSFNLSPTTPVAGSPLTVTGLLKNVGGNYNAVSPTVQGYANPYPEGGIVMFPPWDLTVAPGATVPFTVNVNNVVPGSTEVKLILFIPDGVLENNSNNIIVMPISLGAGG
jgi:hypothetical protein